MNDAANPPAEPHRARPLMADYRDLVIEELADSEARLLERIGELEEAVARYRILAVAAIHDLARLTSERDSKARQLAAVREEFRRYRERAEVIARDNLPSRVTGTPEHITGNKFAALTRKDQVFATEGLFRRARVTGRVRDRVIRGYTLPDRVTDKGGKRSPAEGTT